MLNKLGDTLQYVKRPEWAADDEPFIRLSHSTLDTLYKCERKFEIDKLLTIGAEEEDSVHFSFGHAYGTFVATYLLTQSYNVALLEGWLAYWPIIETDKKNEATFIELAERSLPVLDELLLSWEVASFANGEPAIELSFRIDVDSVFYYVGYMDVVLKHKSTGHYAVLDAKTTGLQLTDIEPLYKFSGQTIGYSIALDAIAGAELSEYQTMYCVGRIGRDPWGEGTRCELHEFDKRIVDRLHWFIGLMQDCQRMHLAMQLGHFQKRHNGCIVFNKTCRHYGVCHMTGSDKVRKFEKDEIEYQFRFKLEDVVQDLIVRAHGVEV